MSLSSSGGTSSTPGVHYVLYRGKTTTGVTLALEADQLELDCQTVNINWKNSKYFESVMPKFQVGGSVSVKEPIGRMTSDTMEQKYHSRFANEIVSDVKGSDSKYKSEFAMEMNKSLAYKSVQENISSDLETELNLYENVFRQDKDQNRFDYHFPQNQMKLCVNENDQVKDEEKYLHNTQGSSRDYLQMDKQTQVETF